MADDFESFDQDDEPNPFDEFSDEQLAGLAMERNIFGYDFEQQTREIIRTAGPQAAATMVSLATSAANENTRMNAAKFVIQTLLDPEGSNVGGGLEEILTGLVKDVEQHANAGAE